MSDLAESFHQLFCVVNSGGCSTDLFKPMGYRTLCLNTRSASNSAVGVTKGGGLEKTYVERHNTTSLKADGIFHLASNRVNQGEENQPCSQVFSQTQKSPRAKCDLSDEGGAYTVEICGVLDQIVRSPGESVSMYILGSDKSPRSRFVQSRLLRWVSDWALKQQSWWATMNFSCTLLPSDSAPIELSSTDSPVLRNQDINDSMSMARISLKSLLVKHPEVSRSLCNTVYTITLSEAKEAGKNSEIIVVESHGWQTIDMGERDYQRALCVALELEPCHGFGLKPGELELLNRLRKATYRNTFLCLSAIENEVDSVEEIKMFELGASLTNAARQDRKVLTLNTIIANQQAEIVLRGNNNKVLQLTNQTLVNSTVEVGKQREMLEEQKQKFDEKRRELEVVIKGLEAKTRCLEKPSPFVEMYKKAENRRKQEVGDLAKEIRQLRTITKDQEQNISSIKKVGEVLRAAETLEAERKLNVWKQSFEVGLCEIRRSMNISRDHENDQVAVIEQLGQAVELFEERAARDRDVMKNLLKYSDQFNEEIKEATNTIKKLDIENERLRLQLRTAKRDQRDKSSFKEKIKILKNDFKDERAKLKECERLKKHLEKELEALEKDMKLKEKEVEKRHVDLEKCLGEAGRWKKEAAGERQSRLDVSKEIKALEKKLKKTQMELDSKQKSTEKERKALEKKRLKDSSQLHILQKELEMQKKMLCDMAASKKEVKNLLKEEKIHLQKENADLQTKLDRQQEKILELQRLQAEVSVLNIAPIDSDKAELTALKNEIVELKGRQSLFISKVGKQKEKISKLKKENGRLLADLDAGAGGGDEKTKRLFQELKESKQLLKKNEERRGKLKNELKITKEMFACMEKEHKLLRKENKAMKKEQDKLRKRVKISTIDITHDVDVTRDIDITRASIDLPEFDGSSTSGLKNPNQNPGTQPLQLEPTRGISKDKAKRRLLYKRKRGLMTTLNTSGVSASSFFNGNRDPKRKDQKALKKKRKI